MTKIEKLQYKRTMLIDQINNTWKIIDYSKMKKELQIVDQEINIETYGFEKYSLIKKINERISELENKKYAAIIEKKNCNDLGRYRKLVETIEVLDKTIQVNKDLIVQETLSVNS